MYYNTTNLKGQRLQDAVKKAKTKNEMIELICRSFEGLFTPDMVQSRFEQMTGREQSLNTVRRCITVLTRKGKLLKTNQFGMSQMGKKMHLWKCL
jgi:hypothetical protein